jgi:anaerobic selenocysteine-containing dehydrogenase
LASQRLKQTLDEHGPDAVLLLNYAGNMGLLTEVYPQRLWNAIGATRTDWALCSNSGHAGLALHYGASYGVMPSELPCASLVVFWGFNAAVSSTHLWGLARQARRENGAQIVVIDPRRSRSARSADLWIRPRPGSDVALAYAVIEHLVRNGHADLAFIEQWTTGFEQLRERAGQWTPERAETVTGVPRANLAALARAYATLRPSATLIGIGLQKCDRGADQVRAVSLIPAVLGLQRGFFYSSSFPVRRSLVSGRSLTKKRGRTVQQVSLADQIRRGDFKFIFVCGMNPALTLPNQHALREGLLQEDVYVVVHETHWTETTSYANLVLPAPTYLEKDDLVIPWGHRYVRLSPQVVQPVTDSLSEPALMRNLASRLGQTEEWLYEDEWAVLERAVEPALGEGCLDRLRTGELLEARLKPTDRYPTPSGKIEFVSSTAERAGLDPLPGQSELKALEGEFIMLASAATKFTSTQFREVYDPIPALVEINPEDATRLGIEDGQVVILSNEQSQVMLAASVTEAVPVGVVWSPRQLTGLGEAPQNALTSSLPQTIGNGPRFNSTRVRITPVEG